MTTARFRAGRGVVAGAIAAHVDAMVQDPQAERTRFDAGLTGPCRTETGSGVIRDKVRDDRRNRGEAIENSRGPASVITVGPMLRCPSLQFRLPRQ